MAEKKCVICGATFNAPPSSKKITCSKECSKTRKKQTHTGKRNVWGKESREKLSKRGETANLKKGTAAAKKSPNSGRFETNVNALVWTLRSPKNKIYRVRNLNKFLRDNPELFDGTFQQARAGITAIRQWQTGRRKRSVTQWKGWELLSVETPEESGS